MRLHACAYVDSIATFNFKPNSKHLLLQWGADSLWREQVCESCSFSSTVSAATTCQLGFSYFCSSMQIRQTKSQISDHRQWLLIQDKHTHMGRLQTFFSRPACACLRVACDPSKPFYTPRCTRISNVPSSCLCRKWWIWSLLDTVLLSRVSLFRSRSSTWKRFHSVDATLRGCYRCCGISTQPWYRYCYPVVFTVWVSHTSHESARLLSSHDVSCSTLFVSSVLVEMDEHLLFLFFLPHGTTHIVLQQGPDGWTPSERSISIHYSLQQLMMKW